MSLYYPAVYADPTRVIFFDDFVTSVYDSIIWSVTGTGTAAIQNSTSGRILITATANNNYYFNHGGMGAFSVANLAKVQWRGILTKPTGGTGGYSECGLQSSTAPTTSLIQWRATRSITNYQCITTSGGSATTLDSGVATDGNDHDFRIECYSGNILFYLDGILRATGVANITANNLQPFVRCAGSSTVSATANMDYVDCRGVR